MAKALSMRDASYPTAVEDGGREVEEFLELVSNLPSMRGWVSERSHQYKGFWFPTLFLQEMLSHQKHFNARDTDVVLTSYPKSGTTWLKALIFSVLNRNQYSVTDPKHPLYNEGPHDLVLLLETFQTKNPTKIRPDTSIMNTHIPYSLLPTSIRESRCKIVYVTRDPKDVLVSFWHMAKNLGFGGLEHISLNEAFDHFCRGMSPCGPFWDHVLEYYKASIEYPEKVLFLRYEEMKEEGVSHAKKLAEFLGCPFSSEEEETGVIGAIVELCSFEKLSNLEINKVGNHKGAGPVMPAHKNDVFFRKGRVGDSKNVLSPQMIESLNQISQQKFRETNLSTYAT